MYTDTAAVFFTWDAANSEQYQINNSQNFTGKIPETSYRFFQRQDFVNRHFDGGGGSSNIYFHLNPDYTIAEGFMSGDVFPGGSSDAVKKTFDTPGHVPSGNPSHVEGRVLATSNASEHILSFDLQLIEQMRDTTTGMYINTYAYDYAAPLTPTTTVRLQASGNGNKPDLNALAWWSFEYDRNFDLNGSRHTILHNWNQPDSSYLVFIGADVNSQAWIFDPARKEKTNAVVSGDTLRFLVPGDNQPRDLYLFTDRATKTPTIVNNTSLSNLSDIGNGAEFVIITDKKFANSANQYAAYRRNNPFNQLSTRVVYMDQIYDEFGYGTLLPYAIKNFCNYACTEWTIKPQQVMLWGKGRSIPRLDDRSNYVPIMTLPPNDWEYVTNFRRDTIDLVPKAGIGRVSIQTDAEGMAYLAKIQDYESQEYNVYLKKAVFLGGGKSSSEYNAIGGTLIGQYMPILESDPLNGQVSYYQKKANGFETNSEISSEKSISAGAGIVQFFGHSAVNIFDIDILEPNRYTNYGKYPFMIAFGCSGGDFSGILKSYGERTILEPNRGSIAYLGNSTSGFLSMLASYGKTFYYQVMGNQYGNAIGDILRGTMEAYADSAFAPQSIYASNQLKQMLLQGDPSVKLRLPTRPDLRISASDVYFPNGNPSALENDFRLNVIVNNDGRSFTDSFRISIKQKLPSGQLVHFDTLTWVPMANVDTIEYLLPNTAGVLAGGINQFTVRLDPLDLISEELETNNEVIHEELFQGSLPAIIYPHKYAIVPDSRPKLRASTYVIRTGPVNYAFEIDTVATFDSPFKQVSGPILGTTVFGEWELPFDLDAGQVYYWKVRLQDFYPMQWNSGSFRYLPGKTGWSQSKFNQFDEDPLNGLFRNSIDRLWELGKKEEELHAFVGAGGAASYFFGTYGSEVYGLEGVCYTAIDHNSLTPLTLDLPAGDWVFGTAPSATDPNGTTDIGAMILEMNDDDYFLMASSRNPKFPLWSDDVLRTFEKVGCRYDQLRSIPDGNPIVVLGKKGALPGTATVITQANLVSNGTPFLDLLTTLTGIKSEGALHSTLIGPSKDWTDFEFDWWTLDEIYGDSLKVDVIGIRKDNTETVLYSKLEQGQHPLASVDANEYPKLRLEAAAQDENNYSAPQIGRWEVFHQPAPEAALDPNISLELPDSIVEGQVLNIKIAGRNLSEYDLDSVLVTYWLQSEDRTMIELGSKRYASLPAHQVQVYDFVCTTVGIGVKAGPANIIVELNPNQDQPEQYHFNNLYYHPVDVKTDAIGPIVNVTIDGKMLMEGDIVSPEPEMVIEINDENAFLPVTVSDSTFRIWFGTERSYRLNEEIIISTDARLESGITRMPENKVRLTFRPGHLEDGEYTLAVQGYDFKGNKASGQEYIIQMNVVNEKAISEVLPYPNPFSTACRFAYTLTGGERPYEFDIEIYTITGRLVKVIDLIAENDVHFGQNITSYAWDGRDEYGDLLANGTYIYRAKTRFHDKEGVKLRDEGVSQYFKNGFGKMYIMR